MVMRVGRPRRSGSRGRGWVIGVVLFVIIAVAGMSRFYTDVLWFREVGYSAVLWRSLSTQFLVGLIVGILTGLIVWINLWVASRGTPAYPINVELVGREDPLDRYRQQLTPYARWIRLAAAAFIGITTGISAGAAWQTYLLWANRVPFGIQDPQFGRDIGFYVFELPFMNTVLDWLWFALMTSLVLSAAAHYFYGAIRPESRLAGVAKGALAHLSVLLGLLALVKAAKYVLGTYELNFSPRGVVTGASYTDVHAQLPALRLLAIISVISAVLFLVNIAARRISLPLAAIGIWIFTSIVAGGVWPWWVQNFSVKPQELQREREFIERNLEATNAAFGLGEIETEPFLASPTLTPEELADNEDVLQNVRLWDPDVLQDAYTQLQAIRTYYNFRDVDIDRYEIDGQMRQILLSPRELSLEDLPDKTWQNQHLRFTHGFGLVASFANEKTTAGQPSFLVKDVPGTVEETAESLELEQPRLYYGEGFDAGDYSVVNSDQTELDFATEDGTEDNRYDGNGGIKIGGIFNQILFAIREGDPNLVLSNLINTDSKMMIYRNVRDRVRRAAPFLSLDHDPYVTAVDGRLVWILDGYTSTRWYPYAERFSADSIVDSEESGVLEGRINYVRNSVKVLVDAYDGTMKFHIIDDEDPMIAAWQNAFPELFTDDEIPDEIASHFRYPEDLFMIQSEVFLKWHMRDPDDFYAQEDVWEIPEAGEPQTGEHVVPTYLLTQLPGESEQEFILTRPFTPRARDNMIALMVGRSDPGHYGELKLLQFPRQRQVPGPAQVNSIINQDPDVSQARTLLGQAGSVIQFGSLVTLPIEDSILYIQPFFVISDEVAIPELKRVVLAFGEDVAMAETFEEALTDLFDLEAPPVVPPGGPPAPPTPPTGGGGDLAEIVAEAGRVYQQAQQALSDGDFEAYGRLIERLGRLLAQAERLSQ